MCVCVCVCVGGNGDASSWHCPQTTLVPPGGSTVVELTPTVPGNLTLVDHAICRLDKGCVGFITVSGKPRKDVYTSFTNGKACVGCKLHP